MISCLATERDVERTIRSQLHLVLADQRLKSIPQLSVVRYSERCS